VKSWGSKSITIGDRNGGNAADAATARARGTRRVAVFLPTRRSFMLSREKENSSPVWTFVALITKVGPSPAPGRSAREASP
jgi:hypothetical protein